MNKRMISAPQAVVLLVVCNLFNTLLFSPLAQEYEESSVLFYGSFVAMLLTAVLLFPAVLYFGKYPEGNLLEDCLSVGKWFGRFCCLLYFLLLMAVLIHTVAKFDFFITIAVFPKASSTVVLPVFLIAAAYGASMGLEGLARAAAVIAAFFAVAILFVDFSLLPEMEALNLRTPIQLSTQAVWNVAWEQMSNNMTVVLLVLLFPRVKGNFLKTAAWYVLAAGLISAILFGVTILVLGNYLQNQSFPFYSIASIAKTGVFQRLDAVQMFFLVLVVYLRVAVYLLFATELLQKLLPRKAHKGAFWGVLLVVLTSGLGIVERLNQQDMGRALWGAGVVLFALMLGLPLIILWKRRKEHGTLQTTVSGA